LFPKLLEKDVFGSLSGGMTEAEIKSKMKDRDKWRQFVDSLTAQSHSKRKKKEKSRRKIILTGSGGLSLSE
jgi:signal recognition particle GTPase